MKNLFRILLAIPVLWTLVYPETGFWTCAVLWCMYAHIESLNFKTSSMVGLPVFCKTMASLGVQRVDPQTETPKSEHGSGGLLVEDPEAHDACVLAHIEEASARLRQPAATEAGGKRTVVPLDCRNCSDAGEDYFRIVDPVEPTDHSS